MVAVTWLFRLWALVGASVTGGLCIVGRGERPVRLGGGEAPT